MKQIFRNSQHGRYQSHDCLVALIKEKKVKITYQSGNAYEKCNTEFFDGYKWNHIIDMLDMGEYPDSSAYNIMDGNQRKKRADDLLKKATKFANLIL